MSRAVLVPRWLWLLLWVLAGSDLAFWVMRVTGELVPK